MKELIVIVYISHLEERENEAIKINCTQQHQKPFEAQIFSAKQPVK